jgi:hypothetical protein
MAILTYEEVKDKASTLRAMTSLDREEFEALAVMFGEAWNHQEKLAGREASTGGRPPQLRGVEEKLFFILFYLKTYPLQEVLGHLFGLSQGQANVWIHRLSGVLKEALHRQGYVPARLPAEMLERLEEEELQAFGIDGTERRINRPQDDERQRQHYSGKKKPTR